MYVCMCVLSQVDWSALKISETEPFSTLLPYLPQVLIINYFMYASRKGLIYIYSLVLRPFTFFAGGEGGYTNRYTRSSSYFETVKSILHLPPPLPPRTLLRILCQLF